MPRKLLVLAPLLLLLTACRQEQLLPVAHAAGSEDDHIQQQEAPELGLLAHPASLAQPVPEVSQAPAAKHSSSRSPKPIRYPGLHDSCYAYILLRPKVQRASAVQARLSKADVIENAFGAQDMDVDLLGDHANIMSLQFPAAWPSYAYASRVTSVIEEYFSNPDILDYMCDAGFAEVRLSARGLNDGKMHLLWTAKVTAEGLVTRRVEDSLAAQIAAEQAAAAPLSNLKPD
jgi:hypothetical protein